MSVPDIAEISRSAALSLYGLCQTGLVVYSAHRWPMLGSAPCPPAEREPWWPAGREPRVLVQLPVCAEPEVVERLVEAAAALDWPSDRLEIQLLDDSDEAVARIGARAVERARASGADARQIRRPHRDGFKAGALAAGHAESEAEFVAVFDADFLPAPDFLRRTLPSFADPGVGLVQARWGHLNRDANALTRAQAAMLDAHFLLEHAWRQRRGRFLSFNGTAGVWRRTCIDAAGGWSSDTLTEDLDLSYRAQLAGWRFVFLPDVVVPGELPESMPAFRSQQHRWAKGALQTARKLLPRIAAARLPWATKLEAFVHLTIYVSYPLMLAMALLLVPLVVGRFALSFAWMPLLQLASFAAGTVPVALFLALGQRRAGRRGGRLALDTGAALVLCSGLCWHLARAVGEGVGGSRGEFVRTPKSGARGSLSALRAPPGRRPSGAAPGEGLPERVLAAALTLLAAFALVSGGAAAVPFLLALVVGLAWVGGGTRARVVASAPAPARPYSRTIFGERFPASALRVSTTILDQSSTES